MSFYARGLQSQIGASDPSVGVPTNSAPPPTRHFWQEHFVSCFSGGAVALAGGIAYLERSATGGTRVATGALLALLTIPAGLLGTVTMELDGESPSALPLATGLAVPAAFIAWGLRSK